MRPIFSLSPLSFRLNQHRADLATSTRDLLNLRKTIDQSAPPRIAAASEARTLQAQYQSLQPK